MTNSLILVNKERLIKVLGGLLTGLLSQQLSCWQANFSVNICLL